MPTSPQETLQSHDVYPCTLTPRAPGPWARPGAMARRAWLRLLGRAAAARLAVPQAWDQRARAPSGPTVLGHLARQCSALDARAGPRHALRATRRPQGWGNRGRRVARAVVARPSHGTVEAAHPAEGGRSQAQGGTPPFCAPRPPPLPGAGGAACTAAHPSTEPASNQT